MDAIGKLASGVAHDFNNLLTVILGFAEILTADVSISPGSCEGPERDRQGSRARDGPHQTAARLQPPAGADAAPLDVNRVIRT